MFSLPSTGVGAISIDEPINLDEPADVIERMLHGLYSSHYDPAVLPLPSLRQLHLAAKAHDKFDIGINQSKANMALYLALKGDPWTGFAYASHINDLELGRRAIQLMRFNEGEEDPDFDLWESLADVKPAWQLAFAKVLSPNYRVYCEDPIGYLGSEGDRTYIFQSDWQMSLKDMADKFNPK